MAGKFSIGVAFGLIYISLHSRTVPNNCKVRTFASYVFFINLMLFHSLCYVSAPDPAALGISGGELKDLGWDEFLSCLRAVWSLAVP